jgi:hypothetical protein
MPKIPPAESVLTVNNTPYKNRNPQGAENIEEWKSSRTRQNTTEGPRGRRHQWTCCCLSCRRSGLREKYPQTGRNLVKFPKKGDLGHCKNWRGIMLLSVPSKVLSRIILDRLKDAIDKRHGTEQAGFRQDKSCTDQIATLRIIIEQSLVWQSTL